MADPKYANLPGIDWDSPDVYATSDPEDDQALKEELEEQKSDAVEILPIGTKDALDKFKGKQLKADGVDFTDKISQSHRLGYDAPKTEYEMLEDGACKIESPQQKLQRLQHEIRELGEEVHRIQENVKQETTSEKMSPVAISKQLEYLQHQLSDLHLEKLLGPDAGVDLSDPQGQLQKRLMSELSSFKPTEGKSATPKKSTGTSECVTYELYYRPEQAQFSKNARLASLEERLERLEAAVGQNPEKLSILTADTNTKSLVGAVATVNSKLSLLEVPNLDQVDYRLASVLQKLNQIAEKKSAQEDLEKQNKVTELYDLVKKWNSTTDSLPQIVERMLALKDLHEQALQFSQAISHLDTAQQEISASLSAHGDMLKQLQSTFNQNTDSIKANCQSLEDRLKSVKK